MFKSMSEILFPPRSAKPVAEGASGPVAADPAFAEVMQEAEQTHAEAAADAVFLVAALQAVLPRPVAPDCMAGEGEGGDAATSIAVPLVAGEPTDDAVIRKEATPTSTTTENADQMLARIAEVAAPALPAEIQAEPAPMPKVAPHELAMGCGPDFARLDRVAPTTAPPQASTAEPTQGLVRQAAPTMPAPPSPTAGPNRHDAVEPTDDRPDLNVADANRPTIPPTPKAEAQPVSPAPVGTASIVQTKIETTDDGATLQEKPFAGMVLHITTDATAAQELPSARVTPLRHDEGATQFLWRRTMQADAAQPKQPDLPVVPRKMTHSDPPSPVPQQGLETQGADIAPVAVADREDAPPAAPPAPPVSTPAAEPKTDRATTLPEVAPTKPEAPALPGMALGPIPAEAAPRSEIHESVGQRHAPATPLRQVVETLAAQPVDVPGRIELTLTPETLGKLHFDMRPEGGGLSIVLSAERADTLDLMRRHLPDLVAELKQAGIQAGSFSFSSWNEGQRAQTPQPETNTFEPTATAIARPTPAPRPARDVSPLGGLNMRF